MKASPAGLAALRDKYLEIRRLRAAHDAGQDEPPRAALRALAARFPGALRELDQLPDLLIEERLQALELALRGQAAAPGWASVQLAYHAWMRFALQVKRGAGAGLDADGSRAQLETREPFDLPPHRISPLLVREALEPPGGRLNPWVYRRVAGELGIAPEDVPKSLFLR